MKRARIAHFEYSSAISILRHRATTDGFVVYEKTGIARKKKVD